MEKTWAEINNSENKKTRINKVNKIEIERFIKTFLTTRAESRGDDRVSTMDQWAVEAEVIKKWNLSDAVSVNVVEQVIYPKSVKA